MAGYYYALDDAKAKEYGLEPGSYYTDAQSHGNTSLEPGKSVTYRDIERAAERSGKTVQEVMADPKFMESPYTYGGPTVSVQGTGTPTDSQGRALAPGQTVEGGGRAQSVPAYGSTGRPGYAKPADPMQGAPQWIQDNQWAARHGSAMPGERNGGSGPAFQSRPQGRGASPYDRYAQSQVPTQRPVYNAVGTTTTMPPRASMPSAGMSQAYGAGTTTYIPARPAQTPVQRTGSQGVSQAGAQQRAAMAALTDLATPTQQAGAQAAAQGLQGVPGLERFRR